MKVLVPVKRVVDTDVKIKVKAGDTKVNTENLKMTINPFCETAVEEAVRLKEMGIVSEIVVVTIGSKAAQEQLRMAMALGADRGIHLITNDELEPISVAKVLNVIQMQEQAQLILLGRQSIDGDNNQTGQMLAALAGLPQATFASAIRIDDDNVIVIREIDGGLQTITMPLPAVVTVDLRLNEPRYATLPNIIKAKRKPLDTIVVDSLGLDLKLHQKVLQINYPAARNAGIMVESVDELVDKLKNEAKVI